jgi:uncharacterized protein (TIGR02301 family)
MRRALLIMLILIGLAQAGPALAQWRVVEVPGESGTPLPRGRSGMLQDLAGALGAVHYFTVACEGRGSQYWRERMMALLEAETAADRRLRDAMIQTFNDQYRERERAFPDCSAEARAARGDAALRGQTLSEALAEPYR